MNRQLIFFLIIAVSVSLDIFVIVLSFLYKKRIQKALSDTTDFLSEHFLPRDNNTIHFVSENLNVPSEVLAMPIELEFTEYLHCPVLFLRLIDNAKEEKQYLDLSMQEKGIIGLETASVRDMDIPENDQFVILQNITLGKIKGLDMWTVTS